MFLYMVFIYGYTSPMVEQQYFDDFLEDFEEYLTPERINDEVSTIGTNNTVLHEAVLDGNVRVVHYLLNNFPNIDVNAQGTSHGYTPLHIAIQTNNEELVRRFIDAGADLDIQTYRGNTALDLLQKDGKWANLIADFGLLDDVTEKDSLEDEDNREEDEENGEDTLFELPLHRANPETWKPSDDYEIVSDASESEIDELEENNKQKSWFEELD